jgi:hypothetical protein
VTITSDDGHLPGVRQALAAREDACWDRLDDATRELTSLHAVPEDEIVERIRVAIALERTGR